MGAKLELRLLCLQTPEITCIVIASALKRCIPGSPTCTKSLPGYALFRHGLAFLKRPVCPGVLPVHHLVHFSGDKNNKRDHSILQLKDLWKSEGSTPNKPSSGALSLMNTHFICIERKMEHIL